MNNNIKIIAILAILAIALIFSACDDLLDPANRLFRDIDNMVDQRNFARGLIYSGYSNLPGYYDDTDYATDDAVTNDRGNRYLRLAQGSWTSTDNPISRWNSSIEAILMMNAFLDKVIDETRHYVDEEVNLLFRMRLRGEAHGLRAMHMYYLLRAHAGFTEDGRLLGVPLFTNFLESDADFNIPRASFDDCIKQILKDLDEAEKYVPQEYGTLFMVGGVAPIVPDKYRHITDTVFSFYNRVFGDDSRQLIDERIIQSFRSRVSLFAASPAFQHSSNTATWADAANHAAKLIAYINSGDYNRTGVWVGDVVRLPQNGHTYYANAAEMNAISAGSNPPEILWRHELVEANSDKERDHFPPTLFGSGRMNPTQNLVDAFPMANGYPITSEPSLSGYDPSDPYAGRDPRLGHYIIFNGSRAGVGNAVISTGSASGTDDGINILSTSTRTGYYMKKRLRMDVNRNPTSTQGQRSYNPRVRITEIYLNYAEAANEAWGPKGTGTNGFSAYDVIKTIRTRAGVGTNNGDPYLEECAADPEKMQELIRNERRLELCFESFRFWDLRRWGANLNETTRGMDINGGVYTPINVDPRAFQPYMNYGPIPHSEILKFNNLDQNKGW